MKLTNLGRLALMLAVVAPLGSRSQTNPVPAPATAAPPVARADAAYHLSTEIDEVIKLSKAGMGDSVVLAYVGSSHVPYHLKADDVLKLKDAGVSSEVITAMLNHDRDAMPMNPATPPASNPPGQYVYNQQLYGPGGPPGAGAPPDQNLSGQPAAPAPGQFQGQAQPAANLPPADLSAGVPPAPEPEVVPVAPGADYDWYPGYWGWNGGWIWIGGGWYPHGWGYHGYGGYHGGFHGGYGGGFHGGVAHGFGGGGHGGGGGHR